MTLRSQQSFYAVNSTEPGFESTLGSANQEYALESTAVNRYWRGPSGRAVRVSSKTADDFSIVFGTTATAIATSSGAMLILGGTVETFYVTPSQTHVAIVSSTDVTAQFTLGYGA